MGIFDFIKDAGAKVFGSDEAEETEETGQPEPINYARRAYLKQQAELAAAEAERVEEQAKSMALHAMLGQYGFDASQLDLQFDDGVVTLTGAVTDQQTLESIILLVGNTAGVGTVDAQVEVLNPQPEATFYTVQKGDTLWEISKSFLGKGNRYREIFEANKPMLTDPDRIYPGQTLRIVVDENVA